MAISESQAVALSGARICPAFRPVAAFVGLSLLFGTLIILVTPPLRGPDETAHFLRAYGVAQGDLVPSIRDAEGRKGIFLPPRLYDGFDFFERVRIKEKPAGFGYGPVFRTYSGRPPAAVAPDAPPTFVPYAGSEGYSPIAYLPQTAAALVARSLDLEFVPTLYLMRFAGLAAWTALIAVAIAMAPPLAWGLAAIALLPAALYGRSVINADGSALAAALLVTVSWLRGMVSADYYIPRRHAFWLMLSALTKPTNIAFVLLTPLGNRPGCWRLFALTTIPAIAVALLWIMRSGADTAAWRMVELTGQAPLAFDPAARARVSAQRSTPLPRCRHSRPCRERPRRVVATSDRRARAVRYRVAALGLPRRDRAAFRHVFHTTADCIRGSCPGRGHGRNDRFNPA